MANIPIAFIICNHIFYYWTNKLLKIINLHTSCIGPCNMSTFDIFCYAFILILSFVLKVKKDKIVIICKMNLFLLPLLYLLQKDKWF